ncbi:redoxin domain-containing protein [Hymenobacter sp. HMF4947]|uniref:Glutathione peroxidase n=1 Tax=Hymenobacter ginkgonis TaxID=2682976 RepID=A0A7K1TKF6_9BACT|nr:glutathione peroxidase [Hymenobacter ginkgonis]MVN78900.1 redoxin domain-containing protein [Hymenobacter ginkgonis]
MKFTALALAAATTLSLAFINHQPTLMHPTETVAAPGTVYDFTVKTIDGKEVKLSKYKGKKILIVNTASKCGFTPQYKELEELSKKYGKKVTVLGFPSNSFNQELASDEEVSSFCEKNYGVTFPLFSTVPVKGDDAAPLYKFLADKDKNGAVSDAPTWNFCKYLVDEKGHVVKFYPSKVKPLSEELVADISK